MNFKMENENQELMVREENEIALNMGVKNEICTLDLSTIEGKKKMYNMLEKCDILLKDMIGQEINIKDIFVSQREIIDKETGEIKNKYRVILIDTVGKTYVTGSYGIFNCLSRLTQIFGMPTWEEGVKVKIVEQETKDRKRKQLRLELVD